MQKLLFSLFALMLFVPWAPQPSDACVHVSREEQAQQKKLRQRLQEGIIIHANGREHLILRVNLNLVGAEKSPESLAWIVTVPAQPTAYKITKPGVFKSLREWRFSALHKRDPYKPLPNLAPGARSMTKGRGHRMSLVFSAPVKVGAYTIQPVRGSKKSDAALLNKWLTKNGFTPVAPKQLHYFLENKFTFLCIKIDIRDTRTRALEPLQVTFPSKKLYYPLKFSSHQGTFDLMLYTFTQTPISYTNSTPHLRKLGHITKYTQLNRWLSPYGWQTNKLLSINSIYSDMHKLLQSKRYKRWYVNHFHVRHINEDVALKEWKEDLFLQLGDTKRDKALRAKRAAILKTLQQRKEEWAQWGYRHRKTLAKWLKDQKLWEDTTLRHLVLDEDKKGLSWTAIGLGSLGATFLLGLGFLAWRRRKNEG